MSNEVKTFVEAAREFCSWCEGERRVSVEEVVIALSLLPKLYSAALQLPDVFGEEEAPTISDDDYREVFVRFASLPFNYYASCFDPHQVAFDEKPVVADAADDLADIWRDLKPGLSLYDSGHINSAIWEWRFHFHCHWGQHLTSVLYAFHCWLSQNQDRLPPNKSFEKSARVAVPSNIYFEARASQFKR